MGHVATGARVRKPSNRVVNRKHVTKSHHAHFKLGLALLYNTFPWVERPLTGNALQLIPVATLCEYFKMGYVDLQRMLNALQEMGMFQELAWRRGLLVVRLAPPPGFAPIVRVEKDAIVERAEA